MLKSIPPMQSYLEVHMTFTKQSIFLVFEEVNLSTFLMDCVLGSSLRIPCIVIGPKDFS